MAKFSINGKDWDTNDLIGEGGFGRVYKATNSSGEEAAIKLVPKDKGSSREMLIVDTGIAPNIIPVIDVGEDDKNYIIVMRLAEKSLRQAMDDDLPADGLFESVLSDIATALEGLANNIVHRDIKPENILYYGGSWCLTDFGISRYVEATTSPDTQKHALSPPYAAPERWRGERASIKTDIYSLGVVGYELLTGHPPFRGPSLEDYSEQHRRADPERPCEGGSGDLIMEMLFKSPDTRPKPDQLAQRLTRLGGGLTIKSLQLANAQEVDRRTLVDSVEAVKRIELERRRALLVDAKTWLESLLGEFKKVIVGSAPTAQVSDIGDMGIKFCLNRATIGLGRANEALVSLMHNSDEYPYLNYRRYSQCTNKVNDRW